jgi:hypothetical protein
LITWINHKKTNSKAKKSNSNMHISLGFTFHITMMTPHLTPFNILTHHFFKIQITRGKMFQYSKSKFCKGKMIFDSATLRAEVNKGIEIQNPSASHNGISVFPIRIVAPWHISEQYRAYRGLI